MVHYTKVISGLTQFVDRDLLSKMNGSLKAWVVGTTIGILNAKAQSAFMSLQNNQVLKTLGLIDGEMVDVDTIYAHLHDQAAKQSATVTIPMIGTLTYSASDVETLYRMIVG